MEIPDIGINLLEEMSARSAPEEKERGEKSDLSELNYLPCLIFPKQDLRIRKYNRLIKDTKGMDDDEILAKCAEFFDIREMDSIQGGFRRLIPRKCEAKEKGRFRSLFFPKKEVVPVNKNQSVQQRVRRPGCAIHHTQNHRIHFENH